MNWYPTYLREMVKAQTLRQVLLRLRTLPVSEVISFCEKGAVQAEDNAAKSKREGAAARAAKALK